MTAFEVRRARPEDADGIARVWVRAWQVAYRELVPDAVLDGLSIEQRRAHWPARVERGDCTFVACSRGIAGYCRVLPPSEVASVYVLPERRQDGIGSAVLAAGLDELRSQSAHATLRGPVEEFRYACCGASAAPRATRDAHVPEARITIACGPRHPRLHHVRRTDHSSTNPWVFAENHPARAFYARFGFLPDGAEGVDDGTGLDEIRLRVRL